MSRDISQNMIVEFGGKEYTPFFLMEFQKDGEWYRYTTLDVPYTVSSGITASGTTTASGTYQSRGFEFESVHYSMNNVVDEATIRIDNLDSVMTALFVGDTLQGEECNLYCGVLDDSLIGLGIIMVFSGEIDSFELDETEIILTVGSPFSRWANSAYGKHSSSCRWKVFGGTECQYSGGESWCDRSYSRCAYLSNTDNFGGFRWLPDLEKKTIWWGPTPKERRDMGSTYH